MSTLDALQTTLAAEHAALHVYGALGARTSQSTSPALFSAVSGAYVQHRARRDLLISFIADLGGSPVAAAAAYQLPDGSGQVAGVQAAALAIERRTAETYAFLVASSTSSQRRWAISALTDAAVRELAFRGTPEMFPGAGEYADR